MIDYIDLSKVCNYNIRTNKEDILAALDYAAKHLSDEEVRAIG